MDKGVVQRGSGAGSRRELIEAHLAFVVKVAAEFRGLPVPLAELVHEGNLGLLEAARRYDPGHGVKFITYAVWWIRKAILKALPQHTRIVHLPNYQMRKVLQVRQAEASLEQQLSRRPTGEELARRLSRKASQIDRIRALSPRIASLDEPDGLREGEALRDRLADPRGVNPEALMIGSQETERLRRAVASLSDEERLVISQRYGLAEDACLTLREVGERIGLSRERVRQIEIAALKRMRRILSRSKDRRLRPVRRPSRSLRGIP